MLHLINLLCKNKTISQQEFSDLIKTVSLNDLINFKQEKTGDNILLYAARCGNLSLIKILNEKFPNILSTSTNHDGKNALHEVFKNPFS